MDFIEEHKNILSQEECDSFINEIKVRNHKAENLYYYLGKEDQRLREINSFLEEKTKPLAIKYIEKSAGIFSEHNLYFNGFALRYGGVGYSDKLHYDPESLIIDGDLKIRAFVGLIYLNTLEEGQLVLPTQGKVIRPEMGKLVMFPASYLYPHFVPPITEERFFVRLHWNLDTEGGY